MQSPTSVCPFPLSLSNRLAFGLIFCMCVGHYQDSQSQGLKIKVTDQGQDAVDLTSILD